MWELKCVNLALVQSLKVVRIHHMCNHQTPVGISLVISVWADWLSVQLYSYPKTALKNKMECGNVVIDFSGAMLWGGKPASVGRAIRRRMSGSRLVRGTRSRLFLYVAVVVVVGMAVYVFHGAQLQLDDARKVADKCQQQQESLSAQLQGKNSLLFNCTYKLQLVNYLFFFCLN